MQTAFSCVHEKTELWLKFWTKCKVGSEGFSGFRDFTLGLLAHALKSRELMNASPPQENGYAIFGWRLDCANCIMVFPRVGFYRIAFFD